MVGASRHSEERARGNELWPRVRRAYTRCGGACEDAEIAAAVLAAQRGDADAFEFLYARYAPRLRRLLLRLTPDEHEAEDMLQLVAIRVLAKIHLYRPEQGRFLSWLHVLARNVAIEHLRHRRPIVASNLDERDAASEDAMKGLSESLCDAFSTLPHDQRSVALLHYIRGLSSSEIAFRLGRTEPSVYGLQNRAQTALRARLIELDCVPSVAA